MKALAALPAPDSRTLALYYEAQTLVLESLARDVQARWLEMLELLEARGVLVLGKVPPQAILHMDHAVRALSGPKAKGDS